MLFLREQDLLYGDDPRAPQTAASAGKYPAQIKSIPLHLSTPCHIHPH